VLLVWMVYWFDSLGVGMVEVWLGFMGLVLCVGLGVVVGCRCDYVGLGVGFSFVGVVLLG